MEEMGCLWSYEESLEELRAKLSCATMELESFKVEAREEMRKHEENVTHLINLLMIAYRERDLAKSQIHKLLNNFASTTTEIMRENPLSILVDDFNLPSLAGNNTVDSSPFGFVTKPFGQCHNGNADSAADVVIDSIAKARTLPETGKLLQAVIDSGPLLQSLLVAGSLPRWRKPPTLQPLKIPPVLIKGSDASSNDASQKQSRAYAKTCRDPLSGFMDSTTGTDLGRWPSNSFAIDQIASSKRQRSQ